MNPRPLHSQPPQPLRPPVSRPTQPEVTEPSGLVLAPRETASMPVSVTTKRPSVRPPQPSGYTLNEPLLGSSQRWRAFGENGAEAAVRYFFLTRELTTEQRERMRKLRTALRHLSHPNLAKVLDVQELGDLGRVIAVISEPLQGQALGEIRRQMPGHVIAPSQLEPWIREICQALEHGFSQTESPHGGLDPYSVWISPTGSAQVLDYGVANCLPDSVRTPYCSPTRRHDYSDDVYSVGALIFDAVSGSPPGLSLDSMTRQRAALRSLDEMEDIPASWERTVSACLSSDSRPKSLTEVMAGLALTAPQPLVLPSGDAGKPSGRNGLWVLVGVVAVTLLGGALALLQRAAVTKPAVAPPSIPAPASPVASVISPNFQAESANSLGMTFQFLAGPNVHFSAWETRVQDFQAFTRERPTEVPSAMVSLVAEGDGGQWKESGHRWDNPEFSQTGQHPVVGVSLGDAENFCAWLSEKEKDTVLAGKFHYRLPTVEEWREAAAFEGRLPWGDSWTDVSTQKLANLGGQELRRDPAWPAHFRVINGLTDAWPRTAPVGSLRPNRHGLYDLAGNVAEWCRDAGASGTDQPVLGGSWASVYANELEAAGLAEMTPASSRNSRVGFRVVIAPLQP